MSAMSASPAASALPLPTCKAGEIVVYSSEDSKPFCGHPCKTTTDCPANQGCSIDALRSLEPTMGMAAAVRNGVSVCAPTVTRPAAISSARHR
jgi:hypothetical protein